MKYILILVALFSLQSRANNYYFSPKGSDNNNGSISSPFLSLNKVNSLVKGDSAFFERGGTFSGKINLKSGIYIGPYGVGNSPVFIYKGSGSQKVIIYGSGINNVTIEGIKFTDYVDLSTIRTSLANVCYAIDLENVNHVTLNNLDISLVGDAVEIYGDSNRVTNILVYDLGGVHNNSNDEGNFGANGITFHGSYNVISDNTFLRCWRYDSTFGYDGGAIEWFGSGSNNVITRNKAIDCEGFLEIGSPGTGIMDNNEISFNILENNGKVVYINNSGTFATSVTNLKFYNNTVTEYLWQRGKVPYLFSSASPISSIIIENNIFNSSTPVQAYKSTIQGVRKNNVYNLASSFNPNSTELIADPLLNYDFTLKQGSPAIDFGVNIGYKYFGNSPDTGAKESCDSVYYVDSVYKKTDSIQIMKCGFACKIGLRKPVFKGWSYTYTFDTIQIEKHTSVPCK